MSDGPVAQAPARSAGEIPRIPLPRERQMAGFASAPLRFLDQWRRELGDTFVLNLAVGDIVLISDPASIKRLFSGDRVHRLAPGRNLALAPLLGSQSLLLQEGPEHLRRRKLMLPPFHGERMRAYEEIIRDSTRVAVAASSSISVTRSRSRRASSVTPKTARRITSRVRAWVLG